MHLAAGSLVEGLSDALSALSRSTFPCLPRTGADTPTHTHAEHFSVMCLAGCKISSLQLEGNRFHKIPFSAHDAFKARNGMAEHGTAR